ncbi:MAG: 16S rRNA (cytosine(1402)-N(4))-methyltransferase RsmH [Clostridium sp.]|nr:16S rRNA (cytosine(1402)-N(4))-methyltransferase RsmH [Clostridium sp.]
MNEEVYHIPALLPEALSALDIKPGGTYVDATFGGGGHSRAILARLEPGQGRLLSFDQDIEAIERAEPDERLTLVHGNFRFLANFLRFYGVEQGQVDGILADLGVSFHHFDDAKRGFSFRFEGPLDMRMNQRAPLTAAELIAKSSEQELADMLYLYGEMKNARKIASALARKRVEAPIDTVEALLEVLKPFINPKQEKKELAQVFQSLRIAVNNELDALKQFLEQACCMLRPGGRLAIITYHSLEDRLVKNFMRAGNFEGKIEKDFYGRILSPMKLMGSKPITPSPEEVERNPRSRSAKLRVGEKL